MKSVLDDLDPAIESLADPPIWSLQSHAFGSFETQRFPSATACRPLLSAPHSSPKRHPSDRSRPWQRNCDFGRQSDASIETGQNLRMVTSFTFGGETATLLLGVLFHLSWREDAVREEMRIGPQRLVKR